MSFMAVGFRLQTPLADGYLKYGHILNYSSSVYINQMTTSSGGDTEMEAEGMSESKGWRYIQLSFGN